MHRRPVREKYADSWVLMDRIHDADDSGEHLFDYLREHRPEINAWFVVERGTPDWLSRLWPPRGTGSSLTGRCAGAAHAQLQCT